MSETVEFDYVIVGAGSAGCVLANRLSADGKNSVLLLEAGPKDSNLWIHVPLGYGKLFKDKSVNWMYQTEPEPGLGGRQVFQPRGKVLGGSSSINAMVYIRGHRGDYDHWAAQGNTGWSYDDVLPYFKRAEHNERGADAWHGTGGPLNVMDLRSPNRFGPVFIDAARQAGYAANPDFNAAEQEGVGMYQVTHRNGERFSAAKAYLAPARSRGNLTVITDVRVTRILTERRRATGVEFIQAGGKQRLGATREVLLCAGALQSPHLLMLSGIGSGDELQRHGITPVHELPGVGHHLHDHPDVVQVFDAPQLKDLFGLSFSGVARVLQGLLEWRRQRSGMLTTNFAEAGGFIKSSAGEPIPDLQLHFVIGKLIDHGRKTVFGHGYSCHVCLLRPKSRGRVSLVSADPTAAPRIDPNFLAERDDVDRLVRGFKLMRNILKQPALAGYRGRE
ncbi:MAG TPA: GMC family oxidoreductase N-terminal domain-containing protein, partial [Burkholderiaceae bacterium]